MFEVSWSELLILAVVTLILVGPKDLPVFLRTIGRYAGAVRRQANEFRQYFDDAMREAEMEELRKELDSVRDEVRRTVREAEQSVEKGKDAANKAARDAATSIDNPQAPAAPEPGAFGAAGPKRDREAGSVT